MEKYIKVNLPITVPNGDYCFSESCVCGHFDNSDFGYPVCLLHIGELHGSCPVKKPLKCLWLEKCPEK